MKQWSVIYAVRGSSATSADGDIREFDSLDECRSYVRQKQNFLARLGYWLTVAQARGPNGEKIDLLKREEVQP